MTMSRAQTAALTQMELNRPWKAWPCRAWVMLEKLNQALPWPNSRGMNACNKKAPTGMATRTARMAHTSQGPPRRRARRRPRRPAPGAGPGGRGRPGPERGHGVAARAVPGVARWAVERGTGPPGAGPWALSRPCGRECLGHSTIGINVVIQRCCR